LELEFEATIDDLVDVTVRSFARSKTSRKWRWQGVLVSAFHVATYSRTVKKRVRKLCREQLGAEDTFKVTVELGEEAIALAQMGSRVSYDWAGIERLEETEDALYFYRGHGGCFAVRKRAFDSVATKDEFLKLAEDYIQRSRGPRCSK
jgi:hypothetical protein